ncbi:MAG: hypothetical protein QXX68_00890 [Candidatus Pacearchaeota archaeon]
MYSWRYYINSPKDLLENEWSLFVIVFLISFAMCYLALSNFFFRKKEQSLREVLLGIKNENTAKGPVIVISLCISLLISFAFTQSDYLKAYLGAGTVLAVLIFSIVVFILLTFPFYVAMEKSFSSLVAGPLFGIIVWAVLKFIFPGVIEDVFWRLPWQWRDYYEFLVSPGGFFLLAFLGLGFGFLKNKK